MHSHTHDKYCTLKLHLTDYLCFPDHKDIILCLSILEKRSIHPLKTYLRVIGKELWYDSALVSLGYYNCNNFSE